VCQLPTNSSKRTEKMNRKTLTFLTSKSFLKVMESLHLDQQEGLKSHLSSGLTVQKDLLQNLDREVEAAIKRKVLQLSLIERTNLLTKLQVQSMRQLLQLSERRRNT
jgi:hypothetical protein